MTQAEGRAAVVAEAMTWLRTPWHHRAYIRGVGVDCAQLPIAVYANCGLIEWFDTGDYPRDWHIHRDRERVLPFVQTICGEIEPGAAAPGDIVLFKIGRVFSHCAIIVDWPLGLHASVWARCVTLCDFDRDCELQCERRFFSYWARHGR